MKSPTSATLLLSLICALTTSMTASAAVTVETGQLEGTNEDGMTVYRGIPFAAPPVGDLRWRAPQPAAKWSGVRTADKFGPPCMQGGGGPAAKGKQGPAVSEDCLYLNVWTPAKSANERLPVMVWIYGGGFTGGATSTPLYSGEQLARKGVVVVSVAYRVGAMGFLAHPGLSAESKEHVSGNYGVLDMIAGLQWVKKNIAAFGGNPQKVTIFGESAGGIAVSMLCASPLAKGLFQGAISESGGSFGPPRLPTMPGENMMLLKDAERFGQEFATKAGAATLADLRKLSADEVQTASRGTQGTGWPIVDGYVIPDDQYKLYQAKRFNDTPILVGYNSDEGLSFGVPATPDAYREATRNRYGPRAESLLKAYPTDPDKVSKTGSRPDPRRRLRLANLELGAPRSQAGQEQGVPVLLRSASRLPGRFSPSRPRFRTRFRARVCVPAPAPQRHRVGQGDFGTHGDLLDELRQDGRSQRTRRACLARI